MCHFEFAFFDRFAVFQVDMSEPSGSSFQSEWHISLPLTTTPPGEWSHLSSSPRSHRAASSIADDEVVGCTCFGTSSTSTSEQRRGMTLTFCEHTALITFVCETLFINEAAGQIKKNAIKRAVNDPSHNRLQLKHVQRLAITINTSGTLYGKNNFRRMIAAGVLSFKNPGAVLTGSSFFAFTQRANHKLHFSNIKAACYTGASKGLSLFLCCNSPYTSKKERKKEKNVHSV